MTLSPDITRRIACIFADACEASEEYRRLFVSALATRGGRSTHEIAGSVGGGVNSLRKPVTTQSTTTPSGPGAIPLGPETRGAA